MWQDQPRKSSFRESLKALEADIQHANSLAASLPKDYGGVSVQMKLSYGPFAPFLLFLVEWMDFSCTDTLPSYLGLLHILVHKVYVDGMPTLSSEERKATLREFYAVIYPSLMQLEGELIELEDHNKGNPHTKETTTVSDKDMETDDECGICMENRMAMMALPSCGHSMCINCYHDWNVRSQSCPFCRGSLKRVSSIDLWVLVTNNDVVDTISLAKKNLGHFYLYIGNLPLIVPDTELLLYDYMI